MKICAVSPGPNDPTSWYRSNGPLIRMQRENDDIQFVEYGAADLDWNTLLNFDILFVQRPAYGWQVALINKAISLGLKIWIDLDDMLWDVHPSSPVYPQYSDPQIKTALMQITSIHPAYVVFTVSTDELKTQLEIFNPSIRNVHVVPNAYDEKLFGHMYDMFPGEKSVWRGSQTHDSDLLSHKSQIEDLILTEELQFDWLGSYPWMLSNHSLRRINHIPWKGFIEYLKHMKGSAYRYAFCFLEDTPFNRCKSNIFWIEATMAGAVMVAPDWPEWQRPGIVNFYEDNSVKAFSILKKNDEAGLRALRMQSVDYIMNHLTLGITNKKRIELLKNLING